MFRDIKVENGVMKCPKCSNGLECYSVKTDNMEKEYMCKHCRYWIIIKGMSRKDQEIIAEEAFD